MIKLIYTLKLFVLYSDEEIYLNDVPRFFNKNKKILNKY